MAKKGDKIKDDQGVEWKYSGGGWYAQNAVGSVKEKQKFSGKGSPVAGTPANASATNPLGNSYLESLDKIQGGSLAAAKQNLQNQVASGGINQAQADAEYSRLSAGYTGGTLGQGLKDIAGGDEKVEAGFKGGAEIGAALFAPGSLGRVDETASPDQTRINAWLDHLQTQGVDPLLQTGLDRANKTADDAQTLDPEFQNVLNLRKAALGGLSTTELLAEKESAQTALNQSLTSATRALRVGRGGAGPQGAASSISTVPLTAQFANSQAELQRKLILDQYEAKKEALNSYSGDTKDIVGGFQANRLQANQAATNTATNVVNDRNTRFNNYVNYNSAMRSDLLNRQLTNLNAVAAEKSGQAASIFGGGAFSAQQQGQTQSFELGKQNLELQKDIFKNNSKNESSGGGGSSSGITSPGGGDEDAFG